MDEFASVLRAWRERIRPEEAGLTPGTGRRTPGLRREELAMLAGVSVEYLVRLEQGRAKNPSPQLLAALARALRLSEDERDHLYRVAGVGIPSRGLVPQHVTPGVQRIVDRLSDVPMAIFSAAWDVLWWNRLWAAITGDPASLRGFERNVVWQLFVQGERRMDYDTEHAEAFAADLVADLRAAVGRYPSDPHLADLITQVRSRSADFEGRWSQAHIAEHRASTKTALSTPVGPITVDCDVLTVPGTDLRLVVYTAVPGSSDAEKLELLSVVGTQALV